MSEPPEDQVALVDSLQKEHWWFLGLRRLTARFVEGRPRRVLDAGCGTGHVLAELPGEIRVGVDVDAASLLLARAKGIESLVRGSVEAMPFEDGCFDLIVSFDVVSQSGVQDDREALAGFFRLLRPGGRLILNVPAHEWLRSGHDVIARTRHRYSRRELREILVSVGFSEMKITHRVSLMFPAVVLRRLTRRNKIETDVGRPYPLVNRLFLAILWIEDRLLARVDLPFGLSIFAVADRPR